jgi:O-antigen biosynthesis protein
VTRLDLPAAERPDVSVVTVTYGGWRWTRRGLEALREHTEQPFEVIAVDNDSPDGTLDRLRDEVRGIRVVANPRNVGFAAAADQGAALARGRVLVFLNPDAMVGGGWLPPLLEALEADPWVGAAVPRLLNPDGTVQEAGGLVFSDGRTMLYGFGEPADHPRYRFRRYVDYGSAACLAIGRRTFLALGGFDPVYAPAYCEDVDLLLRLRSHGPRTVLEPRSEVVHVRFGSSATGEERMAMAERNTTTLRERWSEVLADRPPVPQDPTDAHLVLASRDADATDRILVVGDGVHDRFLADLAERCRLGRVTYLTTGPRAADAAVVRDLCAAGVEVEGPLVDPDAWWRERIFHYTAVVVPERRPLWLRQRLHESQPQASLIAGRDLEGSMAELRRVGLLSDPRAPEEPPVAIR